ncbi:MAG: sulfotransferase [Thermomicrobiales bacterium]
MPDLPPAVRDLHVRVAGERRGQLRAFAVAAPRRGDTCPGWTIRISGSVASAGSPVQAIEAVIPGRILATVRPQVPDASQVQPEPDPSLANARFTLAVDTLPLPREFNFRLRVTLADGERHKVATVRGIREPLGTGYTPRLQPLLVTSLGRMGTTVLMRMLAAHPAVIAYARPPYEVRAGKYWMHLLKTLAAPTDATKRVGAPMEFHLEPLAVGGNPFTSAAFDPWPEVAAWADAEYVPALAAFCQQSIDGWYLTVAAAQGKETAPLVCFAEKHFPDDYPRLLREIYPAARELFLVRDCRDMIASMVAYNARKGFADFGRNAAESDREWLDDLHRAVGALRDAWRERGSSQLLVRYEDLVRAPETTLPPLLAALDLDSAPATVASMIAAAAPDAPELRGHGTAASPAASIGRWQQDLSPDLIAAVASRFDDLLQEFGYLESSHAD